MNSLPLGFLVRFGALAVLITRAGALCSDARSFESGSLKFIGGNESVARFSCGPYLVSRGYPYPSSPSSVLICEGSAWNPPEPAPCAPTPAPSDGRCPFPTPVANGAALQSQPPSDCSFESGCPPGTQVVYVCPTPFSLFAPLSGLCTQGGVAATCRAPEAAGAIGEWRFDSTSFGCRPADACESVVRPTAQGMSSFTLAATAVAVVAAVCLFGAAAWMFVWWKCLRESDAAMRAAAEAAKWDRVSHSSGGGSGSVVSGRMCSSIDDSHSSAERMSVFDDDDDDDDDDSEEGCVGRGAALRSDSSMAELSRIAAGRGAFDDDDDDDDEEGGPAARGGVGGGGSSCGSDDSLAHKPLPPHRLRAMSTVANTARRRRAATLRKKKKARRGRGKKGDGSDGDRADGGTGLARASAPVGGATAVNGATKPRGRVRSVSFARHVETNDAPGQGGGKVVGLDSEVTEGGGGGGSGGGDYILSGVTSFSAETSFRSTADEAGGDSDSTADTDEATSGPRAGQLAALRQAARAAGPPPASPEGEDEASARTRVTRQRQHTIKSALKAVRPAPPEPALQSRRLSQMGLQSLSVDDNGVVSIGGSLSMCPNGHILEAGHEYCQDCGSPRSARK